jgi:hypothetical protein
VAQANLIDPKINERFSEKNFPKCFEEYADMLHWYDRWHTVLDTNDPPFWKWFGGVEELLGRVSQLIEELPWLCGMKAALHRVQQDSTHCTTVVGNDVELGFCHHDATGQ